MSTEDGSSLYKVLVVGNGAVGKTSIIRRYVANIFQLSTKGTIGVDFALKLVQREGGRQITLQIWDVAGQERYGQMTRVYYQGAVAAFVCFDIHNDDSFKAVSKWKGDVDSKVFLPNGSPIPCILLANKCDKGPLTDRYSAEDMDRFCADNNFLCWFETSAQADIGITPAFDRLIEGIAANDDSIPNDYQVRNEVCNKKRIKK